MYVSVSQSPWSSRELERGGGEEKKWSCCCCMMCCDVMGNEIPGVSLVSMGVCMGGGVLLWWLGNRLVTEGGWEHGKQSNTSKHVNIQTRTSRGHSLSVAWRSTHIHFHHRPNYSQGWISWLPQAIRTTTIIHTCTWYLIQQHFYIVRVRFVVRYESLISSKPSNSKNHAMNSNSNPAEVAAEGVYAQVKKYSTQWACIIPPTLSQTTSRKKRVNTKNKITNHISSLSQYPQ